MVHILTSGRTISHSTKFDSLCMILYNVKSVAPDPIIKTQLIAIIRDPKIASLHDIKEYKIAKKWIRNNDEYKEPPPKLIENRNKIEIYLKEQIIKLTTSYDIGDPVYAHLNTYSTFLAEHLHHIPKFIEKWNSPSSNGQTFAERASNFTLKTPTIFDSQENYLIGDGHHRGVEGIYYWESSVPADQDLSDEISNLVQDINNVFGLVQDKYKNIAWTLIALFSGFGLYGDISRGYSNDSMGKSCHIPIGPRFGNTIPALVLGKDCAKRGATSLCNQCRVMILCRNDGGM